MSAAVTVNVDKAKNKIALINDKILKSMEDNSKLVARMAAFQLQKSTLPETFSMSFNKAIVKSAKRIEEDVKSAYTTKSDQGWQGIAFRLITDYINGDRAKKWYANYKSGGLSTFNERTGTHTDYEQDFDKMRKIPRKVDESDYLSYRKLNDYKVPAINAKNHRSLGFVTEDKRKKLINKRLKTIGLAKAGWKACYHLAGGKGLNVSQLGSAGQNRFPSEINTPYNLFGKVSLGSISLSHNNTGYQGKLINNVRYIDDATNESFRATSSEIVSKYMKIIFDLRKKAIRPKLQKSA
jgi:hypothetical protein